MLNLKKAFIVIAAIASMLISLGCSQNQAAYLDQDATQPYSQSMSENQTQPVQQAQTGYQNLNAVQAKQLLDSEKDIQIIDVSSEMEFNSGHIPGAKVIPIDQFLARMGEIDQTKSVFIYCASGYRSVQAVEVLAQSGYAKVYTLENGLTDWPYELVR